MPTLLNISQLQVKVGKKQILNGLDLSIKKGEIHALLGPNGCGKSSLAKTILGYPRYKITAGKILFAGKDLAKKIIEQRVEMGLTLADQNPPSIKGISLETLLTIISDNGLEKFFPIILKNKKTELNHLAQEQAKLFPRQVNYRLSGGEKKLSELFQILALNPKLVIFDEIDSGLDLSNLQRISAIIKQELIKKKTSLLFITHSGAILENFKPDYTHVMLDGKIICSGRDYKKVLTTIKKHGYEQCKHCPFLAD